MKIEYTRDAGRNYLILSGETFIDTDAYQVRMLTCNVIPHILQCRIQSLDGRSMFFYDITSRQSVSSVYEQKKFEGADLKVIFDGVIQILDEMEEHLMNTDQLLIDPEFLYMNPEKREVGFCCFPGLGKPVQEQIKNLTEYILPRIRHEDGMAVMLGYGIYRKVMEPEFAIEEVKEYIYRNRCQAAREKPIFDKKEREKENWIDEEDTDFSVKPEMEKIKETERKAATGYPEKEQRKIGFIGFLVCAAGAAIAFGTAAAGYAGYLPWIQVDIFIAGGIICLAVGALISVLRERKRRKKNGGEEWRQKVYEKRKIQETLKEQVSEELFSEEQVNSCLGQENDYIFTEPGCGETEMLAEDEEKKEACLIGLSHAELPAISLMANLLVIGKLEGAADVVVPLPTISRMHARIQRKDEEYVLSDLNSKNGTFVNGRMLRPGEEYLLKENDEIAFAEAKYRYVIK